MNWFKQNYIRILSLAAGICVLLWAYGCAPTVQSLIDPTKKVTSAELRIEFDTLVSVFEIRQLDIERQNKFRELLTRNALLAVQTGTFNPLGVLTGLAALYGVGSVAKDTKNVVKRIKKTNTNQ